MNTREEILRLKGEGKSHGEVANALHISYTRVYQVWREQKLLRKIKELELKVNK